MMCCPFDYPDVFRFNRVMRGNTGKVRAIDGRRMMGAILLNPPTGSGERSVRHVAAAAKTLGASEFEIANLFATSTRNHREMSAAGSDARGWAVARVALERTLERSDLILLAYGVTSPTGQARQHFENQTGWLRQRLLDFGHVTYWRVGDGPRHPSRWHQFVSDKYQRTSGGSLAERLSMVLVEADVFVEPSQG
jgi:Protein of unknown function (DUF1643)